MQIVGQTIVWAIDHLASVSMNIWNYQWKLWSKEGCWDMIKKKHGQTKHIEILSKHPLPWTLSGHTNLNIIV